MYTSRTVTLGGCCTEEKSMIMISDRCVWCGTNITRNGADVSPEAKFCFSCLHNPDIEESMASIKKDLAEFERTKKPECECGATKSKVFPHSDWCPIE